MSGDASGRIRVRFRFRKLGKVRFTSHRDLAGHWERAFRRVALPLALTEGFSPRPRVAFGLALPTGAESLAEYLDAELRVGTAVPDLQQLAADLTGALPRGIDVDACAALPVVGSSLQQEVTAATWELPVRGVATDALVAAVQAALDATTLPVTVERKGVTGEEDLRPALRSAEVVAPETGDGTAPGPAPVLRLELATSTSGRTARPGDLMAALVPPTTFPALAPGVLRRTAQWIDRADGRTEPLPLPSGAAALAATDGAPRTLVGAP